MSPQLSGPSANSFPIFEGLSLSFSFSLLRPSLIKITIESEREGRRWITLMLKFSRDNVTQRLLRLGESERNRATFMDFYPYTWFAGKISKESDLSMTRAYFANCDRDAAQREAYRLSI